MRMRIGLAVSLVMSVLAGCALKIHQHGNVPRRDGDWAAHWAMAGAVTWEGSGMKVVVLAGTTQHVAARRTFFFIPGPRYDVDKLLPPPPAPEDFLPIQIRAQLEGGHAAISIDPARIRYSTADGASLAPACVLVFPQPDPTNVPPEARCFPCRESSPCQKTLYGARSSHTDIYETPRRVIPLTKKATYLTLFFAVEPDPERSFVISLDGFERDGSPIAVPPVHFEPGDFVGYD